MVGPGREDGHRELSFSPAAQMIVAVIVTGRRRIVTGRSDASSKLRSRVDNDTIRGAMIRCPGWLDRPVTVPLAGPHSEALSAFQMI